MWQYTSYKREEENLGGRDLDLHTTDSHCENVTHTQSERASERASARGLELQKSQVMQGRRVRCTLSQLGKTGQQGP